MLTHISIGLMLACASAWCADFHSLDVKAGEWETTVNGQTTGLPPIPEEALKNMTPEQRARMEAAMQAAGARNGKMPPTKSCMTKEKIDQAFNMSQQELKSCTRTLVNSSSSKQEIRLDCNHSGVKTNGTIKVEAVDSEHIHGSIHMTSASASDSGRAMNIDYTFMSKWIGSACTEK